MTSLTDHIDRLSHVTKAIKSTAASIGGVAGPFTTAVLDTHLGDLIRDVDPSELGLFNLVQPVDPGAKYVRDGDNGKAKIPEITRVEFPGATPLKKPPGRKEDTQKRKELEPELYAQAALKYMDRYESIRPMPRARAQVESIIEQLAAVRENMQKMGNALEQAKTADVPQSPKDLANQEERRIQYLQTRLLDLNNRKEAALQRGKGALGRAPHPKPASSRQHLKPKPPPTSSKTDIREETFWTTPVPAARILHFDSLLSDEVVDLGNVSMSFASPLPAPRDTQSALVHPIDNITENLQITPEEPPVGLDENLNPVDKIVVDEDDETREEMKEGDDEKTVVLKKLPTGSPPDPPSPSYVLPAAITDSASRPGRQSVRTPSGTGHPQKHRVRVTNEVERIVTKIWATVGEIIMPGHTFDVSGSGPVGTKPPRAKETIAHLHTLSTQTPIPASPTTSSLSSYSTVPQDPASATPQQILTAHLIMSLLSLPPHFSMPLQKVKETLADKAQGSLGAGRGTTSVLYGCVAKRLVRIDRGGGEQVVMFDVTRCQFP